MTREDLLKFAPMPERTHDILMATANSVEEKQTNRERKISLVFVCLWIVLFVGTALAVASGISTDILEWIAGVQKEKGLFQQWNIEERINLIRALIQCGEIEEDAHTDMLMTDLLSEQEKNRLVSDILDKWLGHQARIDYLTLHSVVEKAWGPIDTWSLEQKAWLTEIEIEMGIFSAAESFMHVLPKEEDIPLKAAVRIAKSAIIETRRLSSNALDHHDVFANFVVLQNAPEERMWQIFFVKPKNENGCSGKISYDPVLVSAQTGEIVEIPEFGIYYPKQVP